MSLHYLYKRAIHFLIAKHRHGHGIHSPLLYDFICNVVEGNPRKSLIERIEDHYPRKKVHFAITPSNLIDNTAYISVMRYPFKSSSQCRKWNLWRKKNSCLSLELKNCIIVFWDTQLPNRHYRVRS